jgi:hypothetical protein
MALLLLAVISLAYALFKLEEERVAKRGLEIKLESANEDRALRLDALDEMRWEMGDARWQRAWDRVWAKRKGKP